MPPKPSLNVSLMPALTDYISNLVAAGQYRSASEMVGAGLRLLQREVAPSASTPGQKLPAERSPLPEAASSERRKKHG
jgi:Arc/MetJ-type ribon-helix-helix transcriptional regulator